MGCAASDFYYSQREAAHEKRLNCIKKFSHSELVARLERAISALDSLEREIGGSSRMGWTLLDRAKDTLKETIGL